MEVVVGYVFPPGMDGIIGPADLVALDIDDIIGVFRQNANLFDGQPAPIRLQPDQGSNPVITGLHTNDVAITQIMGIGEVDDFPGLFSCDDHVGIGAGGHIFR